MNNFFGMETLNDLDKSGFLIGEEKEKRYRLALLKKVSSSGTIKSKLTRKKNNYIMQRVYDIDESIEYMQGLLNTGLKKDARFIKVWEKQLKTLLKIKEVVYEENRLTGKR